MTGHLRVYVRCEIALDKIKSHVILCWFHNSFIEERFRVILLFKCADSCLSFSLVLPRRKQPVCRIQNPDDGEEARDEAEEGGNDRARDC